MTYQQSSSSTNNSDTQVAESIQQMSSKDYYADSYAHFGIHEEMLKDSVRTQSYRNAIMQNAHLFKDKVVLDVGCGTGILSMFAAKAGAKLVIGVDMSNIICKARQIVRDNGFGEDQIVLIQGKFEEIELPVQQVDIIISEWMGYFLLYESMLDTVLVARDKYLRRDGQGLIFPNRSTMYIAGIEDAEYKEEKISFWDNVYGFDMRSMKEDVMQEPLVDCVDSKAVVTDMYAFKEIDIMTITKEELAFETGFELQAQRSDNIHAFLAWFDIDFMLHKPVSFSTGPHAEYTHWKQTVFYLNGQMAVEKGEMIRGVLCCRPNKRNHRDLDIEIKCDFDGAHDSLHEFNYYHMC